MSTRGVHFKFSVGEVVLCFEPDPSKAHVLYEAKVLECQVQRDKHGRRVPGYLVHFQGWNSSWDRVVGENFILKNNTENQDLMRRLAETARKQKNSQRKHKINDILRETFGSQVPGYSSDVDTTDTNDTDHEHSNGKRFHRDRKANGEREKSKVKKPKQKLLPVELEIPEVLKSRLEDDYYFIEHQRKLTKLPAKRTVVDVLESFMKTFCINALCDPLEREREKTRCATAKDTERLPPHNSINLCRELVDGLRVCFDFVLPQWLLYSNEREQYNNFVCSLTPAFLKQERRHHVEERPPMTKLQPGKRRATQDHAEEPEPKTATRRMTRRSHIEPLETAPTPAQDEAPKAASSCTAVSRPVEKERNAEKEKPAAKPSKRSMVRVRRRLENPWDPPSIPIKQEPLNDVDMENQAPATQGAATSDSQEATGSACEGTVERKEDMMESILSWQILPPEVRAAEVTPSQVYGAFHLLRLFVRLPELLTSIQWNEHHSQIQVKLLSHCLQFLMERQEELFNGVMYEDT